MFAEDGRECLREKDRSHLEENHCECLQNGDWYCLKKGGGGCTWVNDCGSLQESSCYCF